MVPPGSLLKTFLLVIGILKRLDLDLDKLPLEELKMREAGLGGESLRHSY